MAEVDAIGLSLTLRGEVTRIMSRTSDWHWRRLWAANTATESLNGLGLATEHKSEGTFTLEETVDFPLLVLLGQPLAGKSFETKRFHDYLKTESHNVFLVDGKIHAASDERFFRHWFDSTDWKSLCGGDSNVFLLFDAYDEANSQRPSLAEVVLSELGKCLDRYPTLRQRLRVRVFSRPNGWDQKLGTGLARLLNLEQSIDQSFECVLLPPRLSDIRQALEIEGIDADGFLAATSQAHVWSLLNRPKNLEWLMARYGKTGNIPDTQAELFETGLAVECTDATNEDLERNLAVGGRLAFISALSGKYVLDSRPQAHTYGQVLAAVEAGGGKEFAHGIEIDATFGQILRTTRSGLFTKIGNDEMVWSHQTYPEYLAGKYLAFLNVPVWQKTDLLTNPLDTQRRIVPRLIEVAAWGSSFDTVLADQMLRLDPEGLMLSDVAFSETSVRNRLTKAVLDGLEAGRITPTRWYADDTLDKLKTPESLGVLKPYITDSSLKWKTREVAIQIARAAALAELSDCVAEVALDANLDHTLRITAAYFVGDLGTPQTRAKLLPLVSLDPEQDYKLELRGCALRANYPDNLTLREVLGSFVVPPQSFLGSYRHFVDQQLIDATPEAELTGLLRWWITQTEWSRNDVFAESFEEALISKCFSAVEVPEMPQAIVDYLLTKAREHYRLFERRVLSEYRLMIEDQNIRRFVISEFLREFPTLGKSHLPDFYLADLYARDEELVTQDLEWIVGLVRDAEHLDTKKLWLKFLMHSGIALVIDALWTVQEELRECGLLEESIGPISLSSDKAKKLKENWELLHSATVSDEDDDPIRLMNACVEKCLNFAVEKHPTWWWKADEYIQSGGTRSYRIDSGTPSSTLLPAWGQLSEVNRTKLIELAPTFIASYQVPDDRQSVSWDSGSIAVVRAFGLLRDSQRLDESNLRPETLKAVGPAFLCFDLSYDYRETRYIRDGVIACIDSGFDLPKWIRTVAMRSTKENASDLINTLRNGMPHITDSQLDEIVAQLLDDQAESSSLAQVLHEGGDRVSTPTLAKVLEYVSRRGDSESEIARIISSALSVGDDSTWLTVEPLLQKSPEMMKSLFYAHEPRHYGVAAFSPRLSAESLTSLFVLAVKQFPPREDPDIDGHHQIVPRESAGHLRDDVLNQIVSMGTWAAAEALESILPEVFDEVTWLPTSIARTQERARAQTEAPRSVESLMKLVLSRNARVINSVVALREFVFEQLTKLEERLQGESALVFSLWNTRSVTEPKDENEISDLIRSFIKDECEARGVTLDRETENLPGDKLDFYFQYRDVQSGDIYKLPCEVKCCFNRELMTAMRDQLSERYMRLHGLEYGTYLVLCFDCAQWDKDSRKKRHRAPKTHTIESLDRDLKAQARILSAAKHNITSFVMDCRLPDTGRTRGKQV